MNEFWTQFLISQGAEFHNGRVAAYANINTSESPPADATALCDLSHYGVLEISGNDATAFLQGQFTNDVMALADGQAQWNGWCSPKGRLLVTFLLWRDQSLYYLMMPMALLPGIQKRLTMFVLRSKVNITLAGDKLQRFGVTGGSAKSVMAAMDKLTEFAPPSIDFASIANEKCRGIRLAENRYLIVAHSSTAEQTWNHLAAACAIAPAERWDLANIRDGIIEVTPETQDAFVPQMANFELIGGVNFRKGCYPGQEIVARTQYRGILKRRMVRVALTADQLPKSGTPVYSPNFAEQACGSIAMAARVPSTGQQTAIEALVVTQIDAITSDSLFLDPAYTQPLAILDLPYGVVTAGGQLA